MTLPHFLKFVLVAAGMGWAMAIALDDTAVGIALGVAIATAITGATRRGRCGRGQAE